VEQTAYIYACIGSGDGSAVLRLPIADADAPYAGGDQPTTRSVGPLVVAAVELDESGHTVLLALDPRRSQEPRIAVEEGWERPPDGDPWISRVHELNGRQQPPADVATSNKGGTP
jgi:hypothetical protein